MKTKTLIIEKEYSCTAVWNFLSYDEKITEKIQAVSKTDAEYYIETKYADADYYYIASI